MDDEFKAQYRTKYGPSYRVVPPDYERCAKSVADGGRWPTFHQCNRKNGHGPHGAWCKQHDPIAVKAKDEARRAKWRAEWDESARKSQFATDCQDGIRQIAAGHNDPRSLAQSIINKMDGKA